MIRRERGFALILVIWALVLMLSLATGFALAVRHETRVAIDAVALARVEAARIAALNQTLYNLNLEDSDARWQADGAPHLVTWQDAQITLRVRSESGRIDLNRAPRELLQGLFEVCLPEANAEALADAVADWRDRDDRALPQGAESADYAAAGYPYGPSNQRFQSVHELSQVLGFDAIKLDAVLPYLTIYSGQPRVNALSADRLALAAVPDLSIGEAEAFIAARDAALAAGNQPPVSILQGGRRYIETKISNRAIAVDIEVRLKDTAPRREQVVLRLGRKRSYEILTRRRGNPSS